MSIHLLTWDYAVLLLEHRARAPVFVPRPAEGIERFLDGVHRGEADAWLERMFIRRPRAALRRVPRAVRSGPMVGVEHEYTVLVQGRPVDFKKFIHGLGLDGVRVDPVDPHAYRCEWGGMVTADGIEAEVATPPVALGSEAVAEVLRLTLAGRNAVADRLPPAGELMGFSTHLNVTVPDRQGKRRALRYCRTFAPCLMLLLDRADSPGLLVRPRPSRLELCGEHADGDRLVVAMTYAVATTLALVARPRGFTDVEVHTRLAPSRQRYGHHVAPDAFGADLYTLGRAARLHRRSTTVTVQQQLEQTWQRSRAHVHGLLADDALHAVDLVVGGGVDLPAPAVIPADEAL